jgi:hypothetical protein
MTSRSHSPIASAVALWAAAAGLWLMCPARSLAQEAAKPDVWAPFRYFLGSWEGTSKGQAGIGKVELDFQLVLNDRYLQIKNHSTYPPQEKNPKGEVHEDWGLVSFDKTRKVFVYRQFNIEGFVNQYTADSGSVDGKTFVFVSESIENIPPGWRARETYKIAGEDEYESQFDLAEPGKDFEVYSRSHLKRKK